MLRSGANTAASKHATVQQAGKPAERQQVPQRRRQRQEQQCQEPSAADDSSEDSDSLESARTKRRFAVVISSDNDTGDDAEATSQPDLGGVADGERVGLELALQNKSMPVGEPVGEPAGASVATDTSPAVVSASVATSKQYYETKLDNETPGDVAKTLDVSLDDLLRVNRGEHTRLTTHARLKTGTRLIDPRTVSLAPTTKDFEAVFKYLPPSSQHDASITAFLEGCLRQWLRWVYKFWLRHGMRY